MAESSARLEAQDPRESDGASGSGPQGVGPDYLPARAYREPENGLESPVWVGPAVVFPWTVADARDAHVVELAARCRVQAERMAE